MMLFSLVIQCALITLSLWNIMRVFFEKRKTSAPTALFTYFAVFICFLSSQYFDFILPLEIAILLAGAFIASLNYESSMIKRSSAAIGYYFVLTATMQLLARLIYDYGFVYEYLTEPSTGGLEVFDSFNLFELFMIGFGVVLFLLTFILRRFKSIRKNEAAMPMFWLSVTIILALSTISLYLISPHLPQLTGVLFMGLLLVINFSSFYLYNIISAAHNEKLKSALHEQEKEYYFTQCQLMQESVEKVKSIRHDMKTHLAALTDFTADNKAATDYINSLLGDITKNEIYSDTGNIAFDSIINFKLRNAKESNIELDINLLVPPVLGVETVDIVTILGNLLDNALDAVEKAAEKMLRIDIEYGKGGLFIKVENSFDGTVKYAEEKDGEEKRIATLKDDGENGYGLKNIRQSLEKYNGYMEITHTENVFSTGIFLYVSDM